MTPYPRSLPTRHGLPVVRLFGRRDSHELEEILACEWDAYPSKCPRRTDSCAREDKGRRIRVVYPLGSGRILTYSVDIKVGCCLAGATL